MLHIFTTIFDHYRNSSLHNLYILFGGFIGLFGLVSLFVKERLYLTESLVATLFGIAFGPHGFGVLVPFNNSGDSEKYSFFQEFARIIIALQVMAVGVSSPGSFMKSNKKSILMMLGPVMLVMWLVSALCIKFCLGFDWAVSFIIAACITPTDPVLAHSVIKGKFAERYIPTRLRNLLAIESAANDGLGFPFMMLPIWILKMAYTTKEKKVEFSPIGLYEAVGHWLIHTLVWEIGFSVVFGFLCGLGAKWLLKTSIRRKLIDKESFLVYSFALTFFVTGLVSTLASDDLFAVFIAGNVFAWDESFFETLKSSHISEVIDMIFNITFFILFGSMIPWARMHSISGLVPTAIAIIFLRRLPIVFLLRRWIPCLQTKKETFIAGWFGPMGVGAIFFALEARKSFELYESHTGNQIPGYSVIVNDIFPIVSAIVISSIVIHGITVPLTNSHLKKRMKRKHLLTIKKDSEALQDTKIPRQSFPSSTSSSSNNGDIDDGEDFVDVTINGYEEFIGKIREAEDMKNAKAATTQSSNLVSSPNGDDYEYITDDEGIYEAAVDLIASPLTDDAKKNKNDFGSRSSSSSDFNLIV